jgi:photosynthetic reaction center cytochrome c subunit
MAEHPFVGGDSQMHTGYVRRVLTLLIIISGFVGFFSAKTPTASSARLAQEVRETQNETAGQVFKNIQILKDIPASKLEAAMDFMATSLGVDCSFCHTSDRESDEKSTKLTARKMIVMTSNINKQSFSGFSVVNCYTCHRGRTEPTSIPEMVDSLVKPDTISTDSSSGLPRPDAVLDSYETAIGGIEAIDKVSTLVLIGYETSYGPGRSPIKVPIEIYRKAPDRFLYEANLLTGLVRRGFDGKSGWALRGIEVRRLDGDELARVERDADFYQYLKLKRAFPAFRVLGRQKVGDRKVIVAGGGARDGAKAKLYFDAESGLLVRCEAQIKTPLGALPDIIDFDDYRRASGIDLPYKIKRWRPPTMVVQEFKEIRINVPIDDSRFTAPPR